MYLEFYGLESKPFSKTPDPGMLFMSPAHEEALARMEQAVEDRELMILTGDIGCGKTTVSRALIDRLPDSVRPAVIINPRLSPNQLLRTLCRRLGDDEPKYFRADLIDQVHAILFSYFENDVLPMIIIDEAQSIPGKETFEEIRLLTNFQLDDRNLMAVILMGQPELERRLDHRVYESFRQRVGMRFHLGTLDASQVGEYMAFRLKTAGAGREIFDPDAVALIARFSGGIPRWINNIASASMIEGFGRGQKTIGPDIIKDVAQDLGIRKPKTGKDQRAPVPKQKSGSGKGEKTKSHPKGGKTLAVARAK